MEVQVETAPKTVLPECAVCMEAYVPPSVPKSMPCCGHTVCLKCLLRLERESEGRILSCPECRTKSKLGRGGVESFQTNIAIQRIVEQLHGICLQDSPAMTRARKNPADVPLSAPSFVSNSKVPIRVLMPTMIEKKHQLYHDKRPHKPVPNSTERKGATVDSSS